MNPLHTCNPLFYIRQQKIIEALPLRTFWATGLVLLAFFLSACVHTGENQCEDLARVAIPDTEIALAESIPAGDFKAPDGKVYQVPAFCRVHGIARPSADSEINFEVWLPLAEWSGRYYQLGSGGFSGIIEYQHLAGSLRMNNVVAVTDDGNKRTNFVFPMADWALNQPEKIVDYGYRAVTATTVGAKTLVNAFYRKAPDFSYFAGCSGGGRQALMQAQRYSHEWDGIIVGAPANKTELFTLHAHIQSTLNATSGSYITQAKLPAIQRAALASCDANAHVINGIANDPRACSFKAADLLCEAEETDECLNASQVEALQLIMDGLTDPQTGEQLYPGFEPTTAEDWGYFMATEDPLKSYQIGLANGFFQNMVYDDPDWDFRSFDLEHALKSIENKKIAGYPLEFVLNSDDTNLSELANRKGKILMYFGWAEEAIPPRAGIDYYEGVSESLGAERMPDFFRLFMAPGMGHCTYGPGPYAIGQPTFGHPGLQDDPEHSIARAMEAWVEKGIAPEKLIAAKYTNDNPDEGVEATQPLCAYPKVPVYTGSGSTMEAANFVCE